MAIVSISYDCGCRTHCRTVEEAVAHVDATGHTLCVAGQVRPSVRKVRPVKAFSAPPARTSQHSGRPRQAGTQSEPGLGTQTDFNSLRARIRR